MADLKVPYEIAKEPGAYLNLNVPDRNLRVQFIPDDGKPAVNLVEAVERAVESPVEGPKFSQLLGKKKKITFIIENQFRAAPARDILPILVGKARKAGCELSIIIGNAALPPLSGAEIETKLGLDLVRSGIPIFSNDAAKTEQYRYIGTTRAGTPLLVHNVVTDADAIVTLSTTQASIWGYGGSGMILPAVVRNETIELNHLMSMAPDCIPGNNDCFMQLDKYEALELAKVDMAINVIVNNQGKVIYVNAGAPVASHVEAVRFYNTIYQFSMEERNRRHIDVVIAGSTPFTDDLFFHTGWAVANCEAAVRDGGIIILATRCTGYGNWPGFIRMEILRDYLPVSQKKKVEAMLDFYKQIVSGSKSFAWYKIYEVMTRKDVWIVTDKANLPFCKEIGLTAFESIEEAFIQAMGKCGDGAGVAFMPYGRYTIVKPSSG
jgi:nickel-dependent lactate racemase